MKKLSIELILTLGLGFVACYFIGWWAMPIAAAISSFFAKNTFGKAFLAGFSAGTLLWAGYANLLDSANLSVLGAKVALLFGAKSATQMVWATGILGGVLGGLGSMTGTAFRDLVWPEKSGNFGEPTTLFEADATNA